MSLRPAAALLTCFYTALFVTSLRAQGPPASAGPPLSSAAPSSSPASSGLYSNEPFVVRRAETLYSYNADGTGSREQTFELAIQSDVALRSFSVLSIPFASASEHVTFHYARVRHSDGSVVETDLATAMEQPEQVTREAPLYSDLKQAQLPVRSLRVGDILEWQVHIDRSKAEAAGQFWGQQSFLQGAVVLAETVELRVPSGKTVTVWTHPQAAAQPKVAEKDGARVYVWKTSALKPTAGAQAEADAKAKKTKVLTAEEEVDANEGKLPDLAWTTFANWAEVGAWYHDLEAGRDDPDAAVIAKVKDLTANKATPKEKAQAVYDYVARDVREPDGSARRLHHPGTGSSGGSPAAH